MPSWLWILIAYLIGSVSFAVVVSKLFSLPDPHSYGSGNPGATNVLRTGNKAAAAFTLIGDGAKGWLAVFLAKQFVPGIEAWLLAAVALAVFVGHLFPVFHRFAGGKGVATAAGIMLAIDWRLAAAAFAVWLVFAVVVKISSVSSIAAAVVGPIAAFYLFGNHPVAWVFVPIAALLIWRHKGNIQKLMTGRETTFGR
jgi:glycerol-3-phosphate acyltransferase PlsY